VWLPNQKLCSAVAENGKFKGGERGKVGGEGRPPAAPQEQGKGDEQRSRGVSQTISETKSANVGSKTSAKAGATTTASAEKVSDWQVCRRCRVYSVFQGMTDECCRIECGQPCQFD
jgi:hypothetical protein